MKTKDVINYLAGFTSSVRVKILYGLRFDGNIYTKTILIDDFSAEHSAEIKYLKNKYKKPFDRDFYKIKLVLDLSKYVDYSASFKMYDEVFNDNFYKVIIEEYIIKTNSPNDNGLRSRFCRYEFADWVEININRFWGPSEKESSLHLRTGPYWEPNLFSTNGKIVLRTNSMVNGVENQLTLDSYDIKMENSNHHIKRILQSEIYIFLHNIKKKMKVK